MAVVRSNRRTVWHRGSLSPSTAAVECAGKNGDGATARAYHVKSHSSPR